MLNKNVKIIIIIVMIAIVIGGFLYLNLKKKKEVARLASLVPVSTPGSEFGKVTKLKSDSEVSVNSREVAKTTV